MVIVTHCIVSDIVSGILSKNSFLFAIVMRCLYRRNDTSVVTQFILVPRY